jgi:hypothetical protein
VHTNTLSLSLAFSLPLTIFLSLSDFLITIYLTLSLSDLGITRIECSPNILPQGLYLTPTTLGPKKRTNKNDLGYYWEGNFSGFSHSNPSLTPHSSFNPNSSPSVSHSLSYDPHPIPDSLRIYLHIAQKALKRCLKEEKMVFKQEKEVFRDKESLKTGLSGPRILVDRV